MKVWVVRVEFGQYTGHFLQAGTSRLEVYMGMTCLRS